MNIFYVTIKEAKLIAENKSGVFIRLAVDGKPRPEDQEYVVKESWDYSTLPLIGGGEEKVGYLYKADGYLPYNKWRSPASMPLDAVRYKLTVQTRVCRLQDVTWEEWLNTMSPKAYSKAFSVQGEYTEVTYWNNILGNVKPRKTADGKGYECFPYDEDSFYDKYHPDPNLDWEYSKDTDKVTEPTYKGLKLTIHTNCMVEVRNWTKEMI